MSARVVYGQWSRRPEYLSRQVSGGTPGPRRGTRAGALLYRHITPKRALRMSIRVKQRAGLKRLATPEREHRVSARQTRPERITSVVPPARVGDETETVIERIVPGGFGL